MANSIAASEKDGGVVARTLGIWTIAAVVWLLPGAASAQYTTRATVTTSGALTFTGNALGLDGDENANRPGTRGAIGTFITTDTTLQDGSFPPGTTSDWRLNRSEAVLRLPAGVRIIHAELIWGGTFAGRDASDNVSAFINDPILFTTPAGTTEVSPDPGTATEDGRLEGNGECDDSCFYVRTADVTALVASTGGLFAVGRVPATQGSNDNNNPVAGWTLAVFYEDFRQPIRNLTLFLGLERSGGAVAQVAGFCTPPIGTLSGRLAVSAIEGDARLTGDKLLFGPTSSLTNSNRVSGQRNPLDNFFSGQITDDRGDLDTSGTFGNRNHSPGDPDDGARQGWDITNVDASAQLRNNQTSAFAQGTTDGDNYRIMALGLQIDVGAPRFFTDNPKTSDRPVAQVGDIVTYTIDVDNSDGTADANNVVFFDPPPPGMSFVAGSFTVDGVARPAADPIAGVALGTIAVGASVTITLQMRVDSVAVGPGASVRSNQAHWTFDFVSCAGQPSQSGAAETNVATTVVPVADLSIAKTFTTSPAVAGGPVTYQLTVRNAGPSLSVATVTDGASVPALTTVTWTCTPESAASICGAASGTGPVASTATLPSGGGVVYTVTGTLPANTPPGTLSNTASVSPPPSVPDLNLANNTANATVPIGARADISVTKTGPASAQRGTDVTYTITVHNNGPSDATDVLVTDPTPAGLTLVSFTGPCSVAPGCALAAGASQTLTAVFSIPPGYTGADPIPNVTTVTSATTDANPLNNSNRVTTSLDAPVADLAIAKTDNATSITAGQTTTYIITVSNLGPATAPSARVTDIFDPAVFSSVAWQCAASGASACTVSGAQSGNIDTLVTLVPGAGNDVVITATATVLPEATGRVENTARVATTAGEGDPDGSNNSGTDVDDVTPLVDVSIVKTGPATIVAGTTATYTVVVSNSGPSTALLIPASDRVFDAAGIARPELISGFTAPADVPCTIRPYLVPVTLLEIQLRVCDIPELAPTATATFTVDLTVPPDFPAGSLRNVAFIDTAAYRQQDVDTDDHMSEVPIVVTSETDLSVSKTGPASVVAGSIASYFVRVVNNGPSTATNILVEDPIPAGLALVAAEGPCAAGFPCTIATLAPGDVNGVTTRIDLLIPPGYSGPPTFMNTATVSTTASTDSNPSNNSSSVSTLVASSQADLKIEKTGPTSVAPGGTMSWAIRVTNLGPGTAIDVVTSDAIPGGGTFLSGTTPGAPTICNVPPAGTSNLLTCRTPALLPGEFLDFTVTAQASSDLVVGALLRNEALVTASTPDLNPNNDFAEVLTRVAAATEADLRVEKTDTPDPVIAGDNVTYTVVVTNFGPAPATAVNLVDTLPAGLTLVSATSTLGTCTGVTCGIGTLAPSAAATVTIVAATTTTGRFTNLATVSAAEPDPVPANNTATQDTTVALADDADLAIEKIGPAVLQPGDTSVYQIRVTNRGPATAHGIVVEDVLPAGVTFVANSGFCITAFPCSIELLPAGETLTISTTFTVDPGVAVPSTLTNTASVTSLETPDPDLTNNSTSTSPLVTTIYPSGSADLAIRKTDSPDPVVAGTQYSYVLIVGNRGPSVAPDVTVVDPLPVGVTALSVATTVGACSGTTTITCALGSLAQGDAAEIEIVASAPAELPTPNPMSNTAVVTSDGTPDPNPDNNSATEPTTVVARADVQIQLAGPSSVVPGTGALYRITVLNLGPSTATGVTVVDPVPPGLSVSGVGGACAAFPCVLGSIAAGDARTVLVTFAVPPEYAAPNPILSTATVASTSGDPNLANNVATATTAVGSASADVAITKTGPATVLKGGTVTYTIAVTNAGPSTATGVSIDDPPPAGLSLAGVAGACAGLPCAVGSLSPGESRTLTATFTVPSNYNATAVVNTATVSAMSADPVPGNNVASATTQVRPRTHCDFNGDGIDEIVTGAGPGGGPHVHVWSVAGGQLTDLASFYAYDPNFTGGVFVACGDVDGDGHADVVTGPGIGSVPQVRAFSVWTGAPVELTSFYAYDSRFTGGVRVASADIDGDGIDDIVTGAGPSGGPHVRAFRLGPDGLPIELASFYAYDPGFIGGVFVAAGDVSGSGHASIITGTYREGGPLRVFDVGPAGGITERTSFFPYFDRFLGPVHVGMGDVDGDGVAEILTAAGPYGGPHVEAFSLASGAVTRLASFYAYDSLFCDFGVLVPNPDVCDGVYVASADVDGDGRVEIVTGTNRGAGPLKVFKVDPGVSELMNFFPYFDRFIGPVHVAGLTPDQPAMGRSRPAAQDGVFMARNFADLPEARRWPPPQIQPINRGET